MMTAVSSEEMALGSDWSAPHAWGCSRASILDSHGHTLVIRGGSTAAYTWLDRTLRGHREAERMLLSSSLVRLRSLDALHVALAAMNGARTMVTFNRTLEGAAAGFGIVTSLGLPSDA